MNRCNRTRTRFQHGFLSLTLGLLCGLAQAQAQPGAPVQNEAAAGGRNFPIGALRGRMAVVNAPDIMLDGRPDRLSPGARIHSPQHMLLMPASITGQEFAINYTRDAAGLVREVWILTALEAATARASADAPAFGFWPFAAGNPPRDDGKTPYHMLPGYGQ